MRILIEEHQYNSNSIQDLLNGIDSLEDHGRISIHYVGYYYNCVIKDCIFILPKVLIDANNALVLGKYKAEDLLEPNINTIDKVDRDFLYKFAVWIYRAIVVYKNNKLNDTSIIYSSKIGNISRVGMRLSNTFLDIILSLIQFNKDNQSFFFSVAKNTHSGFNKINWPKTINKSTPFIQNKIPIYLKVHNKRRKINYEEELLIIFFSIINYIGDKYGFHKNINCNYELITGSKFQAYINGLGRVRLRQIKYRYFSDLALKLWDLCYAFFDQSKQININATQKEYLLTKSFYIIFEAIIDELIGDNPLPDGMDKKQDDGKIVDHLFTHNSLINQVSDNKYTYYIGDSKYYKMGHKLGKESIYKQYTYARNVIQCNLDIFNAGKRSQSSVKLRDELTEGYNIIPNFFISAKLDKELNYASDGLSKTDRENNKYKKIHFKNRLFDRDTLLLLHYDVNFLFVLSLYARNHKTQKANWKEKIRSKLRDEIQNWLSSSYTFFVLKARDNINVESYINGHFKELVGKIYAPYEDELITLALENDGSCDIENRKIINKLKRSFYVAQCMLGANPYLCIQDAISNDNSPMLSDKEGVICINISKYNIDDKAIPHKIAISLNYQKNGIDLITKHKDLSYALIYDLDRGYKRLFELKSMAKVDKYSYIDHYMQICNEQTELCIYIDLGKEQASEDINIRYFDSDSDSLYGIDIHYIENLYYRD